MDLRASVKSLIDSYPGKGVTPATLASYLERLSDMPEPLVCGAIERLIRTATFLPSIAEIRALVVESCCGLPDEDAAWKLVQSEMSKRVPNDGGGPWQLPPLVMSVVRDIGTYELRTDERGFASRRFRELYRERRAAHVRDLQAGVVPLDVAAIGGGSVVALPERRAS